MSLVNRMLTASFMLASGSFNSSGSNSSTVGYPLRMTFKGVAAGSATMVNCEMAIYGMPLSDMNQLTTLGTQTTQIGKNTVSVQAGDAVNGMTNIFSGTITRAWVDAQAMPQVCFRLIAVTAGDQAIAPAAPTSYAGGTSVSTVMGGIAGQMGMQFEDNGGAGATQLSNPYFPGSLRQQALDCAEAANCEHIIHLNTLAIWPAGQSRASGGSPLVSPQTGMAGYPMFDGANILVRTLFNPSILPGGAITVQSDLTPACGNWNVTKIEYDLEGNVPHGRWFQNLVGSSAGQNVP